MLTVTYMSTVAKFEVISDKFVAVGFCSSTNSTQKWVTKFDNY